MADKPAHMLLAVLLGLAVPLCGCSERVGQYDRPLVVPPWLQGTWSHWDLDGDVNTAQRFEFLDGGEVIHRFEQCNGLGFWSTESLDASWSFGPDGDVRIHGLDVLPGAQYAPEDVGDSFVRPHPGDCRKLDYIIFEGGWELGLGELDYGDLCTGSFVCIYPFDPTLCPPSETPAGCPGG